VGSSPRTSSGTGRRPGDSLALKNSQENWRCEPPDAPPWRLWAGQLAGINERHVPKTPLLRGPQVIDLARHQFVGFQVPKSDVFATALA
jgi:hypothetical protein